jgi:hypothetical protein
VLDAAVRYIEEHGMRLLPEAEGLAEMTGLDPEDVGLALIALRDEYLAVEISGGGLKNAFVRQVYPSARRAVGQWPTPENLAERILAQLEQAVEEEPNEEKRSKLRQAAGCLRRHDRLVRYEYLCHTRKHGQVA